MSIFDERRGIYFKKAPRVAFSSGTPRPRASESHFEDHVDAAGLAGNAPPILWSSTRRTGALATPLPSWSPGTCSVSHLCQPMSKGL